MNYEIMEDTQEWKFVSISSTVSFFYSMQKKKQKQALDSLVICKNQSNLMCEKIDPRLIKYKASNDYWCTVV
jgi:hypothetical protein